MHYNNEDQIAFKVPLTMYMYILLSKFLDLNYTCNFHFLFGEEDMKQPYDY